VKTVVLFVGLFAVAVVEAVAVVVVVAVVED
jgi:hypothetical protein